MPAPPLLVRVCNHVHLGTTYGSETGIKADGIGNIVARTLGRRVRLRGGTATRLAPDRLLVTLAPTEHREHQAEQIENCLLDLATTVIHHDDIEVLPVVSIRPAPEAPSTGPAMPPDAPIQPARPDLAWRSRYHQDQAVARHVLALIAQGRVRLDLQPVRHCHEPAHILYQEALLRLETSTDEAPLSVGVVIPALERLGMMRWLDRYVVHAIIKRLEDEPELHLSCNISLQSARLDAWWHSILLRLEQRPAVARRMIVELTESVLPERPIALSFIQRLRALGVRIAIDDFGTGYSGLDFARVAHADIIKIDRQYLHDARRGKPGEDILHHLTQLCRVLAPHVVIEGAESDEDLQRLRDIGGVYIQGFALDRPASPPKAITLGP